MDMNKIIFTEYDHGQARMGLEKVEGPEAVEASAILRGGSVSVGMKMGMS